MRFLSQKWLKKRMDTAYLIQLVALIASATSCGP
jgi:hypothetical protein